MLQAKHSITTQISTEIIFLPKTPTQLQAVDVHRLQLQYEGNMFQTEEPRMIGLLTCRSETFIHETEISSA